MFLSDKLRSQQGSQRLRRLPYRVLFAAHRCRAVRERYHTQPGLRAPMPVERTPPSAFSGEQDFCILHTVRQVMELVPRRAAGG